MLTIKEVSIIKRLGLLFILITAMFMTGCFGKKGEHEPNYSIIEIKTGEVYSPEIPTGKKVEIKFVNGDNKFVSITSKNGIVSSSENSTFYYTAPEIGKDDILTLSYKDSAGIIKEMEYNILLKSKITFLIYMGAQNSLGTSGFAAADLKEIKNSTISNINKECNVLVYVDIDNEGNNGLYLYNQSETEGIKVNDELITGFKKLSYYGTGNTGIESELKNFLNYVYDNYSSDKYVLDLWSHGDGWRMDKSSSISKAIIVDDGSRDSLNMFELTNAIEGSNLKKLDVIYFDACLMGGIEVGYQLRNSTDYIVASPEVTPGDGGEYGNILSKINSEEVTTSYDISKAIVDSNWEYYYDENENNEVNAVVYAIYDQSKIGKLLNASENFFVKLTNENSIITKIKGKSNPILCYNNNGYNYNFDTIYVDYGDFLRVAAIYDTTITTQVIQAQNALNEYVVYLKKQTGRYKKNGVMYNQYEDNSTGLSFYIDLASFSGTGYSEYKIASDYGKLSWVQDFQNKLYY